DAAFGRELSFEGPVLADLGPEVGGVVCQHEEVADAVDGDPSDRPVDAAVKGAVFPPSGDQMAAGIELLDDVVADIGDVDIPCRGPIRVVDLDESRRQELAGTSPRDARLTAAGADLGAGVAVGDTPAPCRYEVPGRAELDNPVVTGVGDIDVT